MNLFQCFEGKVISGGQYTGLAIENVSKLIRLYYGFASALFDFDDAQANLAGHFSTVLYSGFAGSARAA